MTQWRKIFPACVLAALPALAQFELPEPPIAPVPPMGARGVAAIRGQADMLFQTRGIGRWDNAYDEGARALDDHNYEEAVRRFDAVIDGKSARADGALYWKAYALNRLGRRDDSLTALTALGRDFPNSHWLNDAQVLEAEVKQGSGVGQGAGVGRGAGTGRGAGSAQDTNDDLKLMAINSLMNADPERALPLLEGVLKGGSSPKVKERALFVLTQSRVPRAQQILLDYAKGAGNPDLQIHAIRYLGMSGAADAQQQLTSIYNGSTDTAVKREIIRSLMVGKGRDALFGIAKSEKDERLRTEAIQELGALHATDQLSQLYGADSDPKTKKETLNGLFIHGDAKMLVDLARKEPDPVMKKYIVERLSMMHSKDATDYMMELLK